MGGRGTFASGRKTAYTYKTVGKIAGVKVLQGLNGVKGLPVESHSSSAYIQLHPDGTFKMYREFDSKHYLVKEIAYHPESKLTGNNKPVLHIHEYKQDDFVHRTPRLLTKNEYKKYKKYFKGVK
jgi:hypothetical protein